MHTYLPRDLALPVTMLFHRFGQSSLQFAMIVHDPFRQKDRERRPRRVPLAPGDLGDVFGNGNIDGQVRSGLVWSGLVFNVYVRSRRLNI